MRALSGSDAARPTPLRERILGLLMLAGGAMSLLTVFLPPAAARSDGVVLLCGALALVVGLLLLSAADQGVTPPEVLVGTATAIATALIALATWAGGTGPTGTADNQILFLWVTLFAFYFFSLRHALAQLGLIAVAYGLVLADFAVDEEIPTRMIVTVGTLLLAGLVVAFLRRRTEAALTEAERIALVDELTGALNRRGLGEQAAAELSRARRSSSPVGFLIVDIDGFGAFNEANGSEAGDAVLAAIAHGMRGVMRAEDGIGRVGPDAFGVLVPGAGEEQMRRLAARLREKLARADVSGAVTLSVGGAVARPGSQTFADLARAAERALASVRERGGDGFGLAGDPLPASGGGVVAPDPRA